MREITTLDCLNAIARTARGARLAAADARAWRQTSAQEVGSTAVREFKAADGTDARVIVAPDRSLTVVIRAKGTVVRKTHPGAKDFAGPRSLLSAEQRAALEGVTMIDDMMDGGGMPQDAALAAAAACDAIAAVYDGLMAGRYIQEARVHHPGPDAPRLDMEIFYTVLAERMVALAQLAKAPIGTLVAPGRGLVIQSQRARPGFQGRIDRIENHGIDYQHVLDAAQPEHSADLLGAYAMLAHYTLLDAMEEAATRTATCAHIERVAGAAALAAVKRVLDADIDTLIQDPAVRDDLVAGLDAIANGLADRIIGAK